MAVFLLSASSIVSAATPCVPWPASSPGSPPSCQPFQAAQAEALDYLRENMFPFDKPNADTLFEDGLAVPTAQIALTARTKFEWAASVPKQVWQDAVLPYAVVNEARTDWRKLLWDHVSPIVATAANSSSLADIFYLVNTKLWSTLGSFSGTKSIVFRSEQTPLIYDPMSTMLYGYASCTGISLLLVDALRTVGVPARLVGTPAWHGEQKNGNHNWVEVWLGINSTIAGAGTSGDGWAFIEGAPAGGGEKLDSPCDKWFCNPAHFNHSGTKVFSTKFDRTTTAGSAADDHYPMAWDLANHDIMGEDRSDLYEAACNAC